MSFKLQNPRNDKDIVETPSEDRRDFLLSRGWKQTAGLPPAEHIELPPIVVEDVIAKLEADERRKGKL
jgi:hypothetical protein